MRLALFACVLFCSGALAVGQTTLPSAITLKDIINGGPPTREVVYKKVGDVGLTLAVFEPADAKPGDRRAAAVWVHGGGWTAGDDRAFYPHARYYASRGAVGVSINYRLIRAGGPTAFDSFADCKSAVRYLRAHAAELGIDPARVAVLGDSAGGHLAGCLGTIRGFDDPRDDTAVSRRAGRGGAVQPDRRPDGGDVVLRGDRAAAQAGPRRRDAAGDAAFGGSAGAGGRCRRCSTPPAASRPRW